MPRFSASSIGICGDRGEEVLHEGSDAGRDFLAEVGHLRTVIGRFNAGREENQ